ncbi:hypothetical protein AB833_14340 [Chromatiales bacterium (ex Bugula neritina AB1)]|nr:hypothetical protein AB833_14340 [Chromatiales bacterium (ex Bugula neritina AB1)]
MVVNPGRLSLLLFLLLPSFAAAQIPNLYLAAYGDRQVLGVADGEFTSAIGVLSVGYWIREGIGLELEAGTGLTDDSINSLELSVESLVAANLRLESPPMEDIAAYVLLGASAIRLDSDFSGIPDSSVDSSLTGFRGAIGLTFNLSPSWQLDAGFTHHEYNSDVSINSFRLGMRFILAPQAAWKRR